MNLSQGLVLKTLSKNFNYIFDIFIWINLNCFQMELEPRLKNKIYVPKVFDRFTTRKVDIYYFVSRNSVQASLLLQLFSFF